MRKYRTLKPPPPGTPSLVREFFELAHAERMGCDAYAPVQVDMGRFDYCQECEHENAL